jgi:signal peptide peptidase SppA
MNVNYLLHAIAKGTWAIDPGYAQAHLQFADRILRGEQVQFQAPEASKASEPFAIIGMGDASAGSISRPSKWDGWAFAQPDSIGVIPISGPILKNDVACGPVGSSTIASWIKQADNAANIKAIILKIDSPGGMVDGTQTLADAIRSSNKKVVSFIDDGMAASAAYWFASECDEIIASHATDSIGSIGVFVQIADILKFYEERMGLKIHTIYASQSSEKNGEVRALLEKGDEKPIRMELLDPLAATFIKSVKQARAGKLNLSAGDPFKGKLYMAEEALSIGLIDRIATFEEVVENISSNPEKTKSGGNSKPIAIQTPMKKISFKASFAALATFLGLTPEAGQENVEFDASDENISKLNNLAADNVRINGELATANETITERDSTIASLQGEIAELKKAPGAGPHATTPTNTDKIDTDQPEEILTEVDKEARQMAKNLKD